MATFRYPETGVELNTVEVFRACLDDKERLTARYLRRDGYMIHTISHLLGTNQGRVAEALDEDPNQPDESDTSTEPDLFDKD